jgi:hypothetical protein
MVEVRATDSFDKAARSLAAEAGGGQLLKDLADEIYQDLEPAVGEVRAALLTHGGHAGVPHGTPLLPAIAAAVQAEVVLKGRSAGARIRAAKIGAHNFPNAPKRFNQAHFWHYQYGRNVRVYQVGAPGWFDATLQRDQGKHRRAVEQSIAKSIRRITRRV